MDNGQLGEIPGKILQESRDGLTGFIKMEMQRLLQGFKESLGIPFYLSVSSWFTFHYCNIDDTTLDVDTSMWRPVILATLSPFLIILLELYVEGFLLMHNIHLFPWLRALYVYLSYMRCRCSRTKFFFNLQYQ